LHNTKHKQYIIVLATEAWAHSLIILAVPRRITLTTHANVWHSMAVVVPGGVASPPFYSHQTKHMVQFLRAGTSLVSELCLVELALIVFRIR
jgi:hypothetical protein